MEIEAMVGAGRASEHAGRSAEMHPVIFQKNIKLFTSINTSTVCSVILLYQFIGHHDSQNIFLRAENK